MTLLADFAATFGILGGDFIAAWATVSTGLAWVVGCCPEITAVSLAGSDEAGATGAGTGGSIAATSFSVGTLAVIFGFAPNVGLGSDGD